MIAYHRALARLAVLAALSAAVYTTPAGAADTAPGSRIEVKPADLPAPGATPSRSNQSSPVTRRDDQVLRVPAGFTVSIFADKLNHARWLDVGPNGEVFLAEPRSRHVLLLRDSDSDGDGKADSRSVFAEGFRLSPRPRATRRRALYR